MASTRFTSFRDALNAVGPSRGSEGKLRLYGQFVGSWTMEAQIKRDDGGLFSGAGEIHFGWVLEGRAVQDVWILPGAFYGTTLRIFDPGIDGWHILWNNPLSHSYPRMIGRARGMDIVQEGTGGDGKPIRWSFREITPRSFLWLGERTGANGALELQAEIFAKRVG
ncbi:MAG: hypothetical protein U1E87_02240 [Alphaproteobacteria bacterium]